MVKEAMFGSPGGEKEPLFVSHDNKAISMHNAVQAKLFTPIWEIMGTKMTTRDQQIVMRDHNLTGNNGMQHSVQRQEHTYQSTRANEGIRNKLAVMKEVKCKLSYHISRKLLNKVTMVMTWFLPGAVLCTDLPLHSG